MKDIENKIIKLVADFYDLTTAESEELSSKTNLYEEADELDLIELTMAIESEFNITFECDNIIKKKKTIGNLSKYIEELLD